MRHPLLLAIAALAVLLALHLVVGLSFTQQVSINNGQTSYTTDDLVCAWNVSADTTAINVTWYKDGILDRSTYDNTTLNTTSTVPSADTLKNQAWRCRVRLFNATTNTSQEVNLTVQNSAPTTPVLSNASSPDLGIAVNVTEDETTTYDLNATDPDSDTLTYYLKAAGFCTVTDAATGTVSCTPTHSAVANATQSESPTEANITFWVDDDDPIFAKSASLKVTFNVTPVNDPPSVTVPTQQTNVTDVFNQTFAASDEEHDYPLSATLDTALTDPEISSDVTVSVEGNSTLRIVYSTSPTDYNDVGNRTVTVNLTDARNASSLVNFTLDILSVNQAPYFTNITPQNSSSPLPYTYALAQGDTIIINLSANDPDTSERNESVTFSGNTSLFSVTTLDSTATNATDAQGRINYTAANADVGNHTVLVTITDGQGATNTTTLNFTVTNVNDPPVIRNQSYDAGNTGGNVNITPLVAYLDAPFSYQVNYTDPDLDIGADTLTWIDNTSSFNITQDGLIGFTPSGPARNETINITVRDTGNLSDTRIVTLEVRNNTPPYFTGPFPTLACSEGQPCQLDLSAYAADDDPGDNVSDYAAAFVGGSLGTFSMGAASGLVSFTPLQSEIGNYTANVTIMDSRGATASQLLNITVNNTEDTPVWTRYDFSGSTIVQSHGFTYELRATDQDLLLANSTENLTFTSNLSWIPVTYERTSGDTAYALISFTPNSSQTGAHTVQLNVTDATGLTNSTTVSFTVLAKTDPPNITAVRPYANASGGLVQEWKTTAGGASENITLPENTSGVLFEANVTDDVTPGASLVYSWYFDGVLASTGTGSSYKSFTKSFGFFSSGNHTLRLTVNDTTLESSSFTWNLDVTDVNRPPVLQGNFTGTKNPLNISQSTSYPNYFIYTAGAGGFYDPDDDNVTVNGLIDYANGSETLDLAYAATSCSHATISVSGNDLSIVPTSVGTCFVNFTGTDAGGLSASSNLVNITVTQVPQGSQTAVVSSGGGGGGVTTQNTLIPLQTEVEKPKPLSIVTPQLVTIYQNRTVRVPIQLRNNWTTALTGIQLSADTNATGVKLAFDTDYVEKLDVNGSDEVNLMVSDYRLGEDFEVSVSANVSDPSYQDTALILFNSIEQSQEGQDVQLKVTFAKDLLSEHDECQELNELLDQADSLLQQGKVSEAGGMIDTVINGCKYLISKTQEETQRPGIVRTPLFEVSDQTLALLSWLALAVCIVAALAGLLYYHYRTRKEYDF